MRVSAEGFFLVNLVMNFAMLAAAARGILFISWERLLAASALGAFCALVSESLRLKAWIDALAAGCMLAAAFPNGWRNALGLTARVLTAAVVMREIAGEVAGFGGAAVPSLLVSAAFGSACVCASSRAFRTFPAYVRIRVRAGGHTRNFPALLDTGNIVTEAASGLSVLIADKRALGKVGEFTTERFVRYGSVGSAGEIGCVRPETMEYHDGQKWVRAPDMWLGIYPGVLRGGVHALAPGTLLCNSVRR